jgi:hypothetical protein
MIWLVVRGNSVGFRQLAYLPDRRSTRTDQSVHITIHGFDASRLPYQEKVSTLSISCHGCRYLSRNKVLLGDIATLEVIHFGVGSSKYPTQVLVRSVKQLANEMLFDVAVELEFPQDIWSIESPPKDWAEFSKIEASGDLPRELQIVPRPEAGRASGPKRIPTEPVRHSRFPEPCATYPLPPLLAQLVANLRDEISTTGIATHRAAVAEDTDESLHEFCTQLERKAMNIFEGLVKTFVEELASRSQQVNKPQEASAFSTYARWAGDASKR